MTGFTCPSQHTPIHAAAIEDVARDVVLAHAAVPCATQAVRTIITVFLASENVWRGMSFAYHETFLRGARRKSKYLQETFNIGLKHEMTFMRLQSVAVVLENFQRIH